MVKMETRHPVDGLFGSEFPAICNHCGVMVTGSLTMQKMPQSESNIWQKPNFEPNNNILIST